MTKERPILFQAPMVKAILAGKKTQTRRIVKIVDPWQESAPREKLLMSTEFQEPGLARFTTIDARRMFCVKCPYGKPGDRLWVRETHWRLGKWVKNGFTETGRQRWTFKATRGTFVRFVPEKSREEHGWHKRPSIFMPRWASRITLEITGVRVERLQDISIDDCGAEGLSQSDSLGGCLVEDYCNLWESINGRDSWDANPWVWVVEFTAVPQVSPARTAGRRAEP